jgi:tetratricopeptide (TPR) repeat protein
LTGTFPLSSDHGAFLGVDFSRFSESFAALLMARLPTAQRVFFTRSPADIQEFCGEDLRLTALTLLYKEMLTRGLSVAVDRHALLMAFPRLDGEPVVALVVGLDPLFCQNADIDWLEEIRLVVEGEFHLVKQARVDIQTGLLNMANLDHLLSRQFGEGTTLQLVLVELPPRRSSSVHGFRHLQKCAALLRSFFGRDGTALHYLGQSLFALVWPVAEGKERIEIEQRLVAYLKRAGCHRVHVGSSLSTDLTDAVSTSVLDAAWQALRHAIGRGPYSFCSYRLLAHPDDHPLARPLPGQVRRLSRLWRRSEHFSLVLFHSDGDQPADKLLRAYLNRGVAVTLAQDVLVFLDGVSGEDALRWAKQISEQAGSKKSGLQVSAGVSSYPFIDFSRPEMVWNCRKALLHASFFGRSGCALFDAVSLNISGDVYFGEGDLVRALREYKKGLQCDAGNINLLNSLGVALAMINRLAPARACFEQALAVESTNFMALYNIGLAEQAGGRQEQAYLYLVKALRHFDDQAGSRETYSELQLQLGILACETGRFQQALEYFHAWRSSNGSTQGPDRACYHAGRAHSGVGDTRQAMTELQRALRFDEVDARAMNLLAQVYFLAGEGDLIALALAQKSVELEPGQKGYRLLLAEIQLRCGMFRQAGENARRCIQVRQFRPKGQLLLAQVHAATGKLPLARRWFRRILGQSDLSPGLHQEAEAGLLSTEL